MLHRIQIALVSLVALMTFTGGAAAAGGNYVFDGGTPQEQAQVSDALAASSFDWSLVPAQIVVHIAHGSDSYALPGQIWLDADLLDSGEFSWGVVQHEYAHQVDFLLLDDAQRAVLQSALGGQTWCGSGPHGSQDCERFASTLAWSYWQSPQNSMRPQSAHDESSAMAPAAFRSLLASLIGAPDTTATPRVLASAARTARTHGRSSSTRPAAVAAR